MSALKVSARSTKWMDVQEVYVCICVYVCVCMCMCKITCQSKRRGGVACPCLRHRGTPLDRMSLLVLLSHKAYPCQTLNHCWEDSCWVSSHICIPTALLHLRTVCAAKLSLDSWKQTNIDRLVIELDLSLNFSFQLQLQFLSKTWSFVFSVQPAGHGKL